ncbi:hypothetical protein L3X38_002173 [Prunus dulcis]|uniref:Uncharacterized protein n=1 Tax=Prunus dulcis TaxID=3755 RepID=A0AAD4WU18_PRUDU|nr:hypothetical protein L3X38_002173 [Prunus dulcis]
MGPTGVVKAQRLGLVSKEKPRGIGLTGLAKAQTQAHPNWGWDRLSKRNQDAWDPPDRHKLKIRRTLTHLGSARKEKARIMGPARSAKA